MNGVSMGAVSGARAAYDIHSSSSNQENQSVSKAIKVNGRQRSTSNLRAPLSNLSAGRAQPGEHGQTSHQRLYDQVETNASNRGRGKNVLEVGSHQVFSKHNSSNGNISSTGSDDIPENMYRPDKEEAEGWINREKLAKIENEELQAAGINLAKARSRSKDALGERLRSASRDQLRNDLVTPDGNVKEEKRRKFSSPTPIQPEDENRGGDEQQTNEKAHWDLRTPEEIAAEQGLLSYPTPVLRKSGSKIPVLSPTPHSVTPEKADTDTQIPRKRTLSSTVSPDEGLYSPRVRQGSSTWNESTQSPTPGTARTTSSPVKTRQKSISGSIGSGAKATIPRKTSTNKPAAGVPNGRPRTRGSEMDRPRTSVNAPEGDPPWLADMYKPDPRLPPDQQLIPTLAKKQRQMQWEESGMVPKTYDREFSALAVHENGEGSPSQPDQPETSVDQPEQSESWPLKPMSSPPDLKEAASKLSQAQPNPAAATGGYSTMPKVSSPPMSITSPKIGSPPNGNMGAPSPNIGPSRQTSATRQPSQRTRQPLTPDDEDEKAQKKGCACCIVM